MFSVKMWEIPRCNVTVILTGSQKSTICDIGHTNRQNINIMDIKKATEVDIIAYRTKLENIQYICQES